LRLIISSYSIEALTVSRLAAAAELDVVLLQPTQYYKLDSLIDAHLIPLWHFYITTSMLKCPS